MTPTGDFNRFTGTQPDKDDGTRTNYTTMSVARMIEARNCDGDVISHRQDDDGLSK